MSSQKEQNKALALTRLKHARQRLKAAQDLLVNDNFVDSISRSQYASDRRWE
jgi:hypothetical protein